MNQATLNIDPELTPDLFLYTLYAPTWTAYKRDKKATAQVKELNNVKDKTKAGNFNKLLLPECPALDKINSFIGSVRNQFYLKTAAWGETRGTRVGKADFHMDMMVWIGDMMAQLKELIVPFEQEYLQAVQLAEFELQDMFDPEDYPPFEVVASKFKLSLFAVPLPNTNDIRVMKKLPEHVKEEIIAQVKANTDAAMASTVLEALEGLYKPLAHAALTLKGYHDGKIKKLYDSVIENIRTMASAARMMNVTNNPDIEALAVEAEELVSGIVAKDLKEDPAAQKQVGKKAQELANRIAKLMP